MSERYVKRKTRYAQPVTTFCDEIKELWAEIHQSQFSVLEQFFVGTVLVQQGQR